MKKARSCYYIALTVLTPILLIILFVVSWVILFPAFFYETEAATATDAQTDFISDEEIESMKQAQMDVEELEQSEILKENISNYSGSAIEVCVYPAQNLTVVYGANGDGNFDIPLYVMLCSVGSDIEAGEYETGEQMTWKKNRIKQDEETVTRWNHYYQEFGESYSMGSVYYSNSDSAYLVASSYNKLGTEVSGSCIFYADYDARTLYRLCGDATKVVVAADDETADYVIPSLIPIGSKCYWDPTNNSVTNPWLSASAGSIALASDTIYVERGRKVNLYQWILAMDGEGSPVNDQVEIEGEVDTQTVGEYTVTYRLTYAVEGAVPEEDTAVTITYVVQDTTGPNISYLLNVNVLCTEDQVTAKSTRTKISEFIMDHLAITDLGEEIEISEANVSISYVVKSVLTKGYQRYEVTAEDAYGNTTTVVGRVYIVVWDNAEFTISDSTDIFENLEEETEEETTAAETTTTKKETVTEAPTTKKETVTEAPTTKKETKTEAETSKKTEAPTTKQETVTTSKSETTTAGETETESDVPEESPGE